MPESDDFVETTRRFCSLFTGWLCGLIARQFANLVKNPSRVLNFRSSKKRRRNRRNSLNRVRMEPIDISSSSDSIFESDDDDVTAVSSSQVGRKLPPSFGSGSNTNTRGPHLQHQKRPNNGGMSSYGGHSSWGEHAPSTSYGAHSRASSSHTHGGGNFGHHRENGRMSQSMTREDDQQGHKMGSALYSQSTGVRSKQSGFWDNIGSSRSGDNSGLYHPVELHDSHGSRILPQSIMRGKPVPSTSYASSSDPLQNTGFGEERVTGDERLIFQAALQDLSQPTAEIDVPVGLLSVPLLRHQRIALAWMIVKETKAWHCRGGILADDQGLGKTISTIALIQMEKSLQMKSQLEELGNHSAEALNLDDDDDVKGKANLNASNKNDDPEITISKSKEVTIDKAETVNLDDDENESPNTETVHKMEDPAVPKSSSGKSSSCQKFHRQRPAAGTLIVCPATVLRQWARELDDKVAEEGKLSVLLYHGGNRTKNPSELAKFDVVLTTYSIVSNEVPRQPIVDEDDGDQKHVEKHGLSSEFSVNKKRKHPYATNKKGKKGKKLGDSSLFSHAGALGRVSWFRVVLDEAQTIKNHRTQTARACCGLRAKRRWCLSGTPIQNSVDELYSYFRFLRHDLYSDFKTFCEAIKIPISRDPIIGYKKLQAVLRTLLLRRTKGTLLDGQPIINLPPKSVNMKTVIFTVEERAFYAQLEAESRSQFKAYAAAGTVNQNYANILLMILRLRQACDHPLLVKGFISDSGRRTNLEKAKKLPKRLLMDLLNHLEASSAICLICSDPAEDAVITTCKHVFCYQCVADYLCGDDNLCPGRRCKEQLSDDVLFSETTLRSCLYTDDDGNWLNGNGSSKSTSILSSDYSSSKIKAALEILLSHSKLDNPCIDIDDLDETHAENSVCAQVRNHKMEISSSQGPIKTIVFSQWTRMLDLFEISLNQHGLKYRRLDGSMTLVARDRAVREFSNNPEVTVMLMSLKAGNLGLNMVAACHVILLDLWWNPSTEDQAIDRAHRIGQTRPVTVSRITIKDTVEDRILALQEEKRKMVASAFGEEGVGSSASRLTIDDLRYIFLGSRAL